MSKLDKNKRKKRMKSLILLLFLTVIMLSTATYAWFTSNKSVKIESINVNIAASSGLQISVDAAQWKTVLANSDFTEAAFATNYPTATNKFPTTIVPVSTIGEINTSNGQMKMFKGTVEGASNLGGQMGLTTTDSGDNTGDYVVFDVFFKVDTASQIYLEPGTGVKNQEGAEDKGLQYAARYGFVNEGTVDGTSTAAAAQAKFATTGNAIIVEPNYDAHNANGVYNASTYYSITTSQGTSGIAPVPYLGVKAANSTAIKLLDTNPGTGAAPSSTYFASVGTLHKTNVAYSTGGTGYKYIPSGSTSETAGYMPIFNLPAGITKMRIYLWVEGQDVDCENNASGSDLAFLLKFTLNSAPAA